MSDELGAALVRVERNRENVALYRQAREAGYKSFGPSAYAETLAIDCEVLAAKLAAQQRVIEAAARHIRSFDPRELEGSEFALARELADLGHETGKWAIAERNEAVASLPASQETGK